MFESMEPQRKKQRWSSVEEACGIPPSPAPQKECAMRSWPVAEQAGAARERGGRCPRARPARETPRGSAARPSTLRALLTRDSYLRGPLIAFTCHTFKAYGFAEFSTDFIYVPPSNDHYDYEDARGLQANNY